jgi:hypothetical protein
MTIKQQKLSLCKPFFKITLILTLAGYPNKAVFNKKKFFAD